MHLKGQSRVKTRKKCTNFTTKVVSYAKIRAYKTKMSQISLERASIMIILSVNTSLLDTEMMRNKFVKFRNLKFKFEFVVVLNKMFRNFHYPEIFSVLSE